MFKVFLGAHLILVKQIVLSEIYLFEHFLNLQIKCLLVTVLFLAFLFDYFYRKRHSFVLVTVIILKFEQIIDVRVIWTYSFLKHFIRDIVTQSIASLHKVIPCTLSEFGVSHIEVFVLLSSPGSYLDNELNVFL